MFSNEKRQILHKNQLAEVICQLRFPQILMIDQQAPALFQEQIRHEFPQYAVRKDVPAPKITGVPGNLTLENQTPTANYQFISTDGVWRVNLTSTFISLACKHYTRWETFAQKLDKPLAAFIKTYKPAYFQRIGLRYLNFVSRKALELEGITPVYKVSNGAGDANIFSGHGFNCTNITTGMFAVHTTDEYLDMAVFAQAFNVVWRIITDDLN